MANYYQVTKTSGKNIYYRIGYNLRGEFEFYSSVDHNNWLKIDVVSNLTTFELTQKNNDKISFVYFEEADEIVLNCNLERSSPIQFYNDQHEKINFDTEGLPIQDRELRLIKIEPHCLPFTLQQKQKYSLSYKSFADLTLTTDDETKFGISPRRADEEEYFKDYEPEFNEEQGYCSEKCLNISLQTLGLFMAVVGGIIVALAFIMLNVATCGTPLGIAAATIGFVGLVAGLSFFSYGTSQNCMQKSSEPEALLSQGYN
ncbi:MAG: hypothetical protein H0U70_00935 [Tatlockia sp.]|nr:hypothetical protein [Tatlockia sp.]